MFLHRFALSKLLWVEESIEVKLPRAGLVLDPRVNNFHAFFIFHRLHCHYHKDGITVTLTRPDDGYRDPNFDFSTMDTDILDIYYEDGSR